PPHTGPERVHTSRPLHPQPTRRRPTPPARPRGHGNEVASAAPADSMSTSTARPRGHGNLRGVTHCFRYLAVDIHSPTTRAWKLCRRPRRCIARADIHSTTTTA